MTLKHARDVEEDAQEIKMKFKHAPDIEFLLDNSSLSLPWNELVFRSNTNKTTNDDDNKNNEGNNNESIIIKTNCKAVIEHSLFKWLMPMIMAS